MTVIDGAYSDLTDEQVDRLLDGGYDIATAPEGYAGFAALVQTVTAPPTRSELAREAAALAMFQAHRPVVRASRLKAKVAALVVVVGGLGLTGVAAAANRLPAPVQDSVADVADVVGIQVPHSDDTPAAPVTVPAGSTIDTTTTSAGDGTPVAPNADPNAQPTVPGAASSTASTSGAIDQGPTIVPQPTDNGIGNGGTPGNGGQNPNGDGAATGNGNGNGNGAAKTDNGVGNGGIPGNGGQNPNKKP
jgi:hypothetical protein